MILHLFPKSQFVEEFIFFVNQNFNMKEHQFILYTNTPFEIPDDIYKVENVYDLDREGIKRLMPFLKRADKIIFHNISVTLPVLLRLYFNKSIVQKGIWLIWGGDLYCYRNRRDKLSEKIVEHMRATIIRNIACIATLTDGDYELARKWYKINKKHIRVDYFSYKGACILSKMPKYLGGNKHRIMVGNSATETNHHIEVFEQINGAIDENWEVIVPLSYGNSDYGKLVVEEGQKYFGAAFFPLFQYMDKKEYFTLLNSVDVAVFNNDRQQATGNIMALAYMGKRVYMRVNTTMWEEFVNKQGFKMFDISNLSKDLKNGNICLTQEEMEHNIVLAQKYYSIKDRVKEWNMCFEMQL